MAQTVKVTYGRWVYNALTKMYTKPTGYSKSEEIYTWSNRFGEAVNNLIKGKLIERHGISDSFSLTGLGIQIVEEYWRDHTNFDKVPEEPAPKKPQPLFRIVRVESYNHLIKIAVPCDSEQRKVLRRRAAEQDLSLEDYIQKIVATAINSD